MTVEGVDVSEYQAGEYQTGFYIVRLGYSQTEDPRANQHVAHARANNMPVGGYWALYDSPSGQAQAQACHAIMARLGIYRIAADAEDFPNAAPLQMSTLAAFITEMQVLNGDCGIYSGYWIKAKGGGTVGANWGWLADYTAFDLPAHWDAAFTPLWQYTSSGGALDRDRYLPATPIDEWFKGGDNVSAELDDFIQGMEDAEAGTPKNDAWTQYRKLGWTRQSRAISLPAPVPSPPSTTIPVHNHVVPATKTLSP